MPPTSQQNNFYNSVLTQWQIYESNVQQYRLISIAVQTILFTGTVNFQAEVFKQGPVTSSFFILALISTLGMYHILYFWMPIINARCLFVDYYKYQILKVKSPRLMMILQERVSDKEYVGNTKKRAYVDEKLFRLGANHTHLRATRRKLDYNLPLIFYFGWLIIYAVSLFFYTFSNGSTPSA